MTVLSLHHCAAARRNASPRRVLAALFLLTLSDAGFAEDNTPAQLQGVEVTGSRIRRVDKETANPVLTLSAADLKATGATTIGEILQQTPLIAGAQLNGQYNYPPSGGASEVGLRGLTADRTLLLLDGQRIVTQDVNQIPLAMIERVEILKQGASAVYGSDAIAGVVNIITRSHFKGAEVSASYGETEQGDGGKSTASLIWGTRSARGHLTLGANFDHTQPIHAGDRDWAAYPYGFANNQVADLQQGSVATPNGFIVAPVTAILGYGCSPAAPILTRSAGSSGSSAADFRCFNYSPFSQQGSDLYNFQPENYLQTPTTHASAFALGEYKLNDDVRWFNSLLYTYTHARNQQAPEAFNLSVASLTLGEPVVISGRSLYNPLHVPIGVNYTSSIYSTLYLRASDIGDRIYTFDQNTVQATTGLKGTLFERYTWSGALTYGRQLQTQNVSGIPRVDGLPDALGPSFVDSNGIPTCGTRQTPIRPCTPLDLLGSGGATLATRNTHLDNGSDNGLLSLALDINGSVVKLPAGDLQTELGYNYRRYDLTTTPDALASDFVLFEGNQKPTDGHYDIHEIFGEILVPLVSDLPLVQALNFDFGFRASKYSTFDSTENNKYALEYRPIRDLLIRATYADIFRAPTIENLYGGASEDAPSYVDPCNGLTVPVGSNANIDAACQGVARDGSYSQFTSQAGALVSSNPNLQPETGYTTDFGLVYSPGWYKPLSIEADYWRYAVRDAIAELHLQDSLDACYRYGAYCNNVARDPTTGQLVNGSEPQTNADRFQTTGLDFGVHLAYPRTALGSVRLNLDATYLQKFDYKLIANGATVSDSSVAGRYDANVFDGGFPRLRGTATLAWSRGPWSATLVDSYVGNVSESVPEAFDDSIPEDQRRCPDGRYEVSGSAARCIRDVGSANYVSLSGTYHVARWNADLSLGIDDLFAEEAQLAYSAPVPDTILSLYRVSGRQFYARLKFALQ